MVQTRKNWTSPAQARLASSDALASSMEQVLQSAEYQEVFKLKPKLAQVNENQDLSCDLTIAQQIMELLLKTSAQLDDLGLSNSSIRILQTTEMLQAELKKLADEDEDSPDLDEIIGDDPEALAELERVGLDPKTLQDLSIDTPIEVSEDLMDRFSPESVNPDHLSFSDEDSLLRSEEEEYSPDEESLFDDPEVEELEEPEMEELEDEGSDNEE